MNNIIVSLAGNMGGGGFGGGTESPSLPLGDGSSFGFEWVYDVLLKFLRVFGTLFDFMANPMYTWIDFVLEWLPFSDAYNQQVIENVSKMEFFQMTFYDLLIQLLPLYITIAFLSWIYRCLSGPLTGSL